MKYALLFLLASMLYLPLSATHIVGGSMTYQYLQDNNYLIHLEVLRDCYNANPDAWFDDPASVGVFNEDNELVDEILVPLGAGNDTTSILPEENICMYPSNICIHRTYYEFEVNLPGSGSYTLAYQRCCRTQIIANIIDPLNTGMTFMVTIDSATANSSATFNQDVPPAVFVNMPMIYDASATDIDGDSLVYELSTPFAGADPDIPMPQPPNNPPFDTIGFVTPPYSLNNMIGLNGSYPLTLDPVTGEMTAIPDVIGVFQIGYKVKEYRNGEHINTIFREFIFSVVPPPADLNFDISGQVIIEENIPLDEGSVLLLNRDLSTDSLHLIEEHPIDAEGNYSFTGIPPGAYYLKAIPASTSIYYDQYLPTYYANSAFWYEAAPLNQCDTSQENRIIDLLSIDELGGNEQFSSFIVDQNNSPISGLDLLLATPSGDIIQARTTDQNGAFQFKNIEAGEYEVLVDLINAQIDNTNPPVINIPHSNNLVGILNETYLEFVPLNSTNHFKAKADIKIYPNPAGDYLNVSLPRLSPCHFKIVDVHGAVMVPTQTLKQGAGTIDLSHLRNGVYWIVIEKESQILTKRFLRFK